jgi:hypothetical protein
MDALKATQDSSALKALKRLGVDVAAYETPDDSPDARSRQPGDALEDQ